jgi:hypothetical protein
MYYVYLVAVSWAGQGRAIAHAQLGNQLCVREVLVRPHAPEVEDLPEAHRVRPHVRLGGVAPLRNREDDSFHGRLQGILYIYSTGPLVGGGGGGAL